MKKLGRPKLPKSEKKQVFPLRFSRSELAGFQRAARAAGKGLREWISETLIHAVGS
jgi:hypothetical protein